MRAADTTLARRIALIAFAGGLVVLGSCSPCTRTPSPADQRRIAAVHQRYETFSALNKQFQGASDMTPADYLPVLNQLYGFYTVTYKRKMEGLYQVHKARLARWDSLRLPVVNTDPHFRHYVSLQLGTANAMKAYGNSYAVITLYERIKTTTVVDPERVILVTENALDKKSFRDQTWTFVYHRRHDTWLIEEKK